MERICRERALPQPEQAARQVLNDVREHAGLLLERGAGEYGFIHLTFQEYLAAVAIAQRGQRDVESVVKTLGQHIGDDNWHEVSLLTIGYMGIIQQLDEVAGEVVRRLIKQSPGEPGAAVVLAGQAVVDAQPGGVDQATGRFVQTALARTMAAHKQVSAPLRVAAGAALGRLGDSRPGVALLPPPTGGRAGEGAKLPDIAWCEVPDGPFLYGGDKQKVELPAFRISKYPVTNAQYAAFVAAGGYKNSTYWEVAAADGVWRDGWVKRRYENKKADRPYDFGDPFNLPNHPVVGITWYEALAYCVWLTEVLRNAGTLRADEELTLPTEQQWEKAARGTDGRDYPWVAKVDPNRANYDQTGLEATSEVGCFINGASPFDCEEMSGNVWEWCRTKYDKPEDNDFTGGTDVLRVLRGGAVYDGSEDVRCAARNGGDPDLRLFDFRVCVVVSPLLTLRVL